ncbi:capsule assembly Wzi family protein [Sphingobacterium multivorum]|uniref:capsule assembly Wzi family protein n=1 Tax=Sphingobacterium multivorum TaxID=28454 RepID=UPI000EEC2067|nr:capsule assembly Wzi family protein [Sphingobacterium multivorum]HAF36756.1 hypothetical protein [Sphingobacterium sp.]
MRNSGLKLFGCLLVFGILFSLKVYGQVDSVRQYIDITFLGGYTNITTPFWMRSNQFGSIPLSGISGSLVFRAARNYALQGEWTNAEKKKASPWDWGYGLETRLNLGEKVLGQLTDAHAKVRYKMFEAKLGRTKDVMGLNGDTLLSSGNFVVSGNALGVPMLAIRISEYYRLPWFNGLFSFKGNFANGYMGAMSIDTSRFAKKMISNNNLPTFLHQKSLYGRIGRKDWRLNLYGGFSHQVQWGAERKVYGDEYTLSNLQTLAYVLLGKAYGTANILSSKLGNQIGSIDIGFSYDWDHLQLMAYRQNFYDVGALSKLANIADGLNGITLTNKRFGDSSKNWDWHKFLVEFFYSKNQAGYPWSIPTKSGDENYYNNYYYSQGWSYKGQGLGSPLIVTAKSVRNGQANDPGDYFISNRVVAGHLGARGCLYGWNVSSKLTVARHYGTFATSIYGNSTGAIKHEPYTDKFIPVSQFSGFIAGERELKSGLYLGISMAMDQGNLLTNSIGGQVSLRKVYGHKNKKNHKKASYL